jgi:predicted dehydrogenase
MGCGKHCIEMTEMLLERPDVGVKIICDPDTARHGPMAAMVEEKTGRSPECVQDFRRALDDRDVDAMLIITGHNWHSLATIMACQAGKDVYVEKPLSLTLREGRKAVEAARKYDRVVQVGTQTRSAPDFQEAVKYVKSGRLGAVYLLRGQEFGLHPPTEIPVTEEGEPIPETLDYDLWCGPAPKAPYHPGRWWWASWDYWVGMGDHAAHQLDMMRAFTDQPYPKAVCCMGGIHHLDDGRQLPDSLYVMYEYDGLNMIWQGGGWCKHFETPFHAGSEGLEGRRWALKNRVDVLGTDGMLFTARRNVGWHVFQKQGREQIVAASHPQGAHPTALHIDNFLDCIRTRRRPVADVEEGHLSMLLFHIAAAAYRSGNLSLRFDGETESFVDSPEANKFLGRPGRAPWLIPEKV